MIKHQVKLHVVLLSTSSTTRRSRARPVGPRRRTVLLLKLIQRRVLSQYAVGIALGGAFYFSSSCPFMLVNTPQGFTKYSLFGTSYSIHFVVLPYSVVLSAILTQSIHSD